MTKIVVNRDLCEANQRCMKVAPEAFQVDEEDRLHVLIEHVDPELRPKIERAVRACPKRALTLVEE
jgi:ferredoxin